MRFVRTSSRTMVCVALLAAMILGPSIGVLKALPTDSGAPECTMSCSLQGRVCCCMTAAQRGERNHSHASPDSHDEHRSGHSDPAHHDGRSDAAHHDSEGHASADHRSSPSTTSLRTAASLASPWPDCPGTPCFELMRTISVASLKAIGTLSAPKIRSSARRLDPGGVGLRDFALGNFPRPPPTSLSI